VKTQNLPILKSIILWSVPIITSMLLLSAWAWRVLPEGARMPVHWNAAGEIDRYGSLFEGLLLIPLISVGLAALLMALPLFEPRQSNLLQSSRAYIITSAGILLFMLCLHAAMILAAMGKPVNVPRVVLAVTGILFIVIGNLFGQVRSNYFFGVRTPWTLSSELSWNKTHRFSGRLFMLHGLLVVLCAFLASEAVGLGVLLGGLFAITAVSMVYSYRIWKADPDKQSKAAA